MYYIAIKKLLTGILVISLKQIVSKMCFIIMKLTVLTQTDLN